MKIFLSSKYSRFLALLRFLFVKIFLYKKVHIKKISYFGKGLKLIVLKNKKIVIDGKIHISDNVEIQSRGRIVFGDRCAVNSYSRIIAFEEIILGERVLIAQDVSILDHDHKFLKNDDTYNIKDYVTKPIIIGNNVWIGDKVTITKGVTIGNNVIIGANSVVTRDIPSNSVYGGVPAKKIRDLKEI